MRREKEIHIFVDTSPKMHEAVDKETSMERVHQFLMGVVKRGDRQPAYMHRIHIHIGDEYLPIRVGNAKRTIRESKDLIYRPGKDLSCHESLWSTVLDGDGPDENLFFILTSGVEAETLNKFNKYKEKVMFFDFSGHEPYLFTDEQIEQVHVVRKHDVRKMVKNFHREFLAPYMTKVNFGISMKTELLRSTSENEDENFQLSEITVVGRTSWKAVELVPILGKSFIAPVNECYDKTSSKIKSHEAYNILKQLLEPESQNPATTSDDVKSEGVKNLAMIDAKMMEGEIPEPTLLVACAMDRYTQNRCPVILRLHAIDKNDKIYGVKNEDVVMKSEDVDYRGPPPESPASPECPASPDAWQMMSSVNHMPKIIPLDAIEDSEEVKTEEAKILDTEDVPGLLNPLEDSEDVVVDFEKDDDGMRIEVIVLKMSWDTFVDSIAFADDEEEIEELTMYEKEPEEPETLLDDTKLVGWYTSDAVAHHIQKVHRAIKRLTLRQAEFDCHIDNMMEMMEYSQNADMAWQLAVAIRAHGHCLDSEDEEIVEEAASKFDKMCWEIREAEKSKERFVSSQQHHEPPESMSSSAPQNENDPPSQGPPAHHQYQFQNRRQFLEHSQRQGLPPPELAKPQAPPTLQKLLDIRFEDNHHAAKISSRGQRPEYDLEPHEYPEEHGFQPKRLRGGRHWNTSSRLHNLHQGQQENQNPHQGPQDGQKYMEANTDQQAQISGRRLEVHFAHRDPLTQYDDIEHPEEPNNWVVPRAKGFRGSGAYPTRYRNRGAGGSAY